MSKRFTGRGRAMNDTAPLMTDANVTTVGGNVVISNVHPTTREGWEVVVPLNLPVEVRDHYYDDGLGRAVVTTTSYPTLVEAMRAVGEAGGGGA